jgi:hypothetical protein
MLTFFYNNHNKDQVFMAMCDFHRTCHTTLSMSTVYYRQKHVHRIQLNLTRNSLLNNILKTLNKTLGFHI